MTDLVLRRTLRQELEQQLTTGRCAYCGARASPERPLTREHLVPRSRGGGRHDHRIIVPACGRCNYRRGCQDLILFLLARPCRISALLDHFSTVSPATLRHVDVQVYAELYAAIWVLEDCLRSGGRWRDRLDRIRAGRTVHRRRYAARRIVGSAGKRLSRAGDRCRTPAGPTCLIPDVGHDMVALALGLAEPLLAARLRLLTLLSLAWGRPAEEVASELESAHRRGPGDALDADADAASGQRRRRRKRRMRVDDRRGRGARPRGTLYGRRVA